METSNAVTTPTSLLSIPQAQSGPTGPVGPFGLPPVVPTAQAAAPTTPPAAPAAPIAQAGTAGQGGQAGGAGAAGGGGQGGQAGQGGQSPAAPSQSNPFGLTQVMGAIQNQINSNNQLVNAKNLVLKQLYDVPLTDAEKATLDPGLRSALDSGDRNIIDFNLRLLNDQIAGRTNTMDSSVKYLADSYNTQQQQIETQRQNALTNVTNTLKDFITFFL